MFNTNSLEKYRSTLIATVVGCSAFLSLTSVAVAGVNGSGGGQAVISPSGTVRLLDLIPKTSLPTEGMASSEIQRRYFESHRLVKTLAVEDPNFFQCAIQKMKVQPLRSFQRLEPLLKKLSPLRVQFRIPSVNEETLSQLPLPMAAGFSERIPQNLQEPLASYVKGRLWISERIAARLGSQDQCGLQVHEGLRHLNYSGILTDPLTTSEIEIATRWLMNVVDSTDNLVPVLAKLNNTNKTGDEWNDYANQKYAASHKLRIYEIDHWDSLSEAQRADLEKQSNDLTDEANFATAKAMGATLATLGAETAIFSGLSLMDSIGILSGLTSPAPAMKCYDIIRMQAVVHFSCKD